MKRKFLVTLLLIICLTLPLGLTSCGDKSKKSNDSEQEKIEYYTVTFDSNGGSEVAPMNIEKWGYIDEPLEPQKNGYMFDGWYNEDDDELWDFENYFVTEDITLIAKWSFIYKITYNLDGGTNNVDNPETYTANTETITFKDPTKTGYDFVGWFTAQEGGSKVATIEKGSKGNKTLYARWTKAKYTVAFNSDGGSTVNPQTDLFYGDKLVKPQNPKKEHYDFVGWFYNNKEWNFETSTVSDNITLKAKWTPTAYKITYILNGGTNSENNPNTYTIETPTITLQASNKTNYFFGGWFSDSSFKNQVIKIEKGTTGNLTLYAKWDTTMFTVTFDSNGGSTVSPQTDILYGEKIEKPQDPKKDGLNFAGWFYNDEKWDFETSTVFKNITLKAKWAFIFEANGNTITGLTEFGKELSNITIPQYVDGIEITTIGENAFKDYEKIISVEIPSNITTIKEGAFSGCSSLERITLPFVGGSVSATNADSTTLFGYIFGTNSYTGGVETKQYYASKIYDDSSYSNYYIPSSLKEVTVTGGNILYGAFYNCSNIEKITLGEDVISVRENAFYSCISLEFNEYDDGLYLGNSNNPYLTLVKSKDTNITSFSINNNTKFIYSYAFYNCSSLTNVTIPNSVIYIGENAFSSCSSLTNVTIPNSVTHIRENAFSSCSILAEITIPNSVTHISSGAFKSCSILEKVYYTGTLSDWCKISFSDNSSNPMYYDKNYKKTSSHFYLNNEELTKLVIPSDITVIKDYTFTGFNNISDISITANVTAISNSSFSNCRGLTEIEIPENVKSIGNDVFSGCVNLTNITLPSKITSIGDNLFSGCVNLEEIDIPKTVTSIGSRAFEDCRKLEKIEIPNSVISIEEYAFANCLLLEKIEFEDNSQLARIGSSVFYKCSSLKNIVIPITVTRIDSSVFSGCSKLESIALPFIGNRAGITSNHTNQYPLGYIFGESAYENSDKTTQYYYGSSTTSTTNSDYYIPSGLKEVTITGGNILDYAFYNCSKIEKITLSENVNSIGENAFQYCSSLIHVYYDGTLSNWCNISFTNEYSNPMSYAKQFYLKNSNEKYDELLEIIIPNDITIIKNYTFYGFNNIENITITEEVTDICNYAFSKCNSIKSIVIPNNVINIGSSVFSDCASLENVTFENNSKLTNIDSYLFSNCIQLKEITIPKSVTSINEYAFSYCASLEKVTFEDNSKLSTIREYAFSRCKIEEIEIPNSVTSIEEYAFINCSNLKTAEIPGSVTSIGASAFSGCSALKKMTLPFVGNLKSATIPGRSTLFGYIFGTASYSNSSETKQYYSSKIDCCETYYIPYSLKEVIITGGNLLDGAFYNCSKLEIITIGESITSLPSGIFYGCSSLKIITLPFVGDSIKTSSDLHQYPLGYVFGTSEFFGGVKTQQSYYNLNTNSPTSSTYYIPSSLTEVTITGGNILYGAFIDCLYIEKITLPEKITNIGEKAFSGCKNLKTITIPNKVTTINSSAFKGCENLTSIKIPVGVTTIGESVFYGCKKLASVKISNTVTSIGNYAFYGCNDLTNIEIPSSITSIGEYAFEECYSFSKIYYNGTPASWYSISVSSNNNMFTSAIVYYYSETAPTETGNFWHYAEDEITIVEWNK